MSSDLETLNMLAGGMVNDLFHQIADAIEEDPDEVVEVLRSDEPLLDKLEQLRDVIES